MPKKRNEHLAEFIFTSRRSGRTYVSIAKAVALSPQRVQQIFRIQSANLALQETGFYLISEASRRALIASLRKQLPKAEITARLVAETFFDGDLHLLGERVYRETAAWLEVNGYILKDGFRNYLAFRGKWRAIATHLANGRRARWTVDRVYDVVVTSRDRALIEFGAETYEVRLVDLCRAFERIEI
jgi:hypothetical protein